jgi:nucleolar protein 58
MLVLFETAAGFALFKVLDEGKLKQTDDLWKEFETPSKAGKIVSLKKFSKFENTEEALASATALVESKMSKDLKKFLTKNIVDAGIKDSLAVADKLLGNAIKEKLNIKCVHDTAVQELIRGIRQQLTSLVAGMTEADVTTMALGLSHSLSRYKLKFSPDKVDTMIVQAVSLLDDMNKELNIYAMRVREWYGWHFPELGKIVTDNLVYARLVKTMGIRENAGTADLESVLPEDLVNPVKEAAQISMGTEVNEEDIEHVVELCTQVIEISEYVEQLDEYLKTRMMAIAPNLTEMVGVLIGARLIARAGSLLNLAKYPASTIQILGAEKALFSALKKKQATPKYGLLYNASIVGHASAKNKGKISRVLAAKTSLAVRVDALGESDRVTLGLTARAAVEHRLKQLESGAAVRTASKVR